MDNALQSHCNCRKCTSLTLKQRIGVIHEYESHRSKKPSIKSLASKFDCCYSEIKKILLNRDAIIFAYKSMGRQKLANSNEMPPHLTPERLEKLEFFGKVMFEYIQRVMYCKYAINEQIVLKKAIEIKHHMCMTFFDPGEKWLENFRITYGLIGFDPQSLRLSIQLDETKRPHLSASDIINYVKRMERIEEINQCNGGSPSSYGEMKNNEHILPDNELYDDMNGDEEHSQQRSSQNHLPPSNHTSNQSAEHENSNHFPLEPSIVYECNDDDPQDYGNSYSNSHYEQQDNHVNNKKRSSNLTGIESVEEALEHLKLLEEYAMLQDNFRAIGLLTQLEQCFTKQSRTE
ncbi:uncharacterized protein LOC106091598 [Stomoxys calcitrans]|uniref:uncharacterized protein LOC106091598 n=1 Tax=Stomoxys calcitrans TaxID=35570 RepID=UPI0027E3617F|nr:uncharacterized protein LOC106091598 [Stomoxys calcitrans]